MPGSSAPERYHLVAPLPPLGGWRRMLALDRRGAAAGPVVLSYAPPEVLEDPARLAALARDAEAGARVHHPNVLPVLGLETVDDQLVLVEPYRAGTTVRALLEASGRMPAELAVRVACDAAAGIAAMHALDPGDGVPFAHGALSAERILVAEDGAALVTGVGTGAGRSAPDDVRSLAVALAEMITGEPPAPAAALDSTGVPPALVAVVDRARGVGGEALPRSAAALAEALAAAFPPAAATAVAVYVESSAPPPAAVPAPAAPASAAPPARAPAPGPAPAPPPLAASPATIPEVSAELIAPHARAAPEPPEVSAELVRPAPEASAELLRPAPPDAARTFPAPRSPAPRRRVHPALILLAVVIPGFALGFVSSRTVLTGLRGARQTPRASEAAAPERAPAVLPEAPADAGGAAHIPAPPPPAHAAPSPGAAAPAPAHAAPVRRPAIAAPEPAPAPATPPRKLSMSVSSVPPGEILVDGKRVGRSPLVVEVTAGEHEVRLRDRAEGVDVRRRVKVHAPATPVHFKLARGTLEVTAPPDTEVIVDGQPVGLGNQRVELWEGWHEVEARRGAARVKQRFQLTSVVTRWTYDVTPTP
ncbi:MAG TPA: PEGA domain-containing protein [Anaeromyxobacter sp.]|nr:PEGA domain-containing protein [Anaeromyxobacter sp.]